MKVRQSLLSDPKSFSFMPQAETPKNNMNKHKDTNENSKNEVLSIKSRV